eukprot:COSAG02_NODE_24033_length_699_cov_267.998333_1_plen_30_part_10
MLVPRAIEGLGELPINIRSLVILLPKRIAR